MRFTILLSLFTLHISLLSLPATPITSLDKEASELVSHIQAPSTLVLTVRTQADLPQAQRLLTLAVSQTQPTLVLIALPENSLESLAIRQAATRYFKSEFSRKLTYFIKENDHPYPEYKTLQLSPIEPAPLYTSKTYPETLPKAVQ